MDILSRYQKLFLGLGIFLSLFAVSITNVDGGFKLVLSNYPVLMIILVASGLLLAVLYISIDKYKIKVLSNQIRSAKEAQLKNFQRLLELTPRQREVYELIVSGKTNKEIMSELYIEQSTLKTHINQIYKKLNINNRKELKSRVSD